jgi:tetratricopeptide (TPR) repeat protein
VIDQETLDELWDFGDPAASEARFRGYADPELRTQLARALGLQGRFAEAHAVLDSIDVPIRSALERGRLYNSADDPTHAIPLFEQAAAEAHAARNDFLEIDALHMIAIADADRAEAMTDAALAIVATTPDARTRRWATSLHNNLGWQLHDSGQPQRALDHFQLALTSAATDQQKFWAHWAVARCLRTLGRNDEARAIQLKLQQEDPGDEDVLDELRQLAAE